MQPSPIILHHIQKTAGTSLGMILNRLYPEDRTLGFDGGMEDIREFEKLSEEQRGSYDYFRGHIYYGLHEIIPRPCTYITILRDPIERVISFFYFVKRQPEHYLWQHGFHESMTLREFMEQRQCIELDNFQTRALNREPDDYLPFGSVTEQMRDAAIRNLDEGFDAVGITERFDDFVRLLRHRYGWPEVPYRAHNVTQSRPRAGDFDDQTLSLVREANLFDIQVYHHARTLFEKQFKEVIDAEQDLVRQ